MWVDSPQAAKMRGQGGIEPPTSRTQSENHTSRPLAHDVMGKGEARGIRTPNLRVWNPTRCHCAIASRSVQARNRRWHAAGAPLVRIPHGSIAGLVLVQFPFPSAAPRAKNDGTPRGIRTLNPQIRSLMRYPVAPVGQCLCEKVPSPGFEPGSVG